MTCIIARTFLYLNALHDSSRAGSSSASRAASGPSVPELRGLRTNVFCRVRVRSCEVYLPSLDAHHHAVATFLTSRGSFATADNHLGGIARG